MSLIDFGLFAHLQWVFFFVSCESPLCSSCVLCLKGDCIFCLSTPVLMSFLSFRLPTARPVACTYTWDRLGLLFSEGEFSFKDLDESNLACPGCHLPSVVRRIEAPREVLLEKEMATHSSILAWRIPGTGAWWAAVYGVAQSRTRLR